MNYLAYYINWQVYLVMFAFVSFVAPSARGQELDVSHVEKSVKIPECFFASHVNLVQSSDDGYYAIVDCSENLDVSRRILLRLNKYLDVVWYRVVIDSTYLYRQFIVNDRHRGCYMVDVQRIDSQYFTHVVRYNASGSIVVDTMSNQWISFVLDAKVLKDGRLIMVGASTDTVIGLDGFVRRVNQNQVLALDTNSRFLWKCVVPGTESLMFAKVIINIDTQIYCVLRGRNDGATVMRLNLNGNVLWTRSFSSQDVSPAQITVGHANEIIVATNQPFATATPGLTVLYLDTNGKTVKMLQLSTVYNYPICFSIISYGMLVVQRTGSLRIFDWQGSEILSIGVSVSREFRVLTGDCLVVDNELIVVNTNTSKQVSKHRKSFELAFVRYRFQSRR